MSTNHVKINNADTSQHATHAWHVWQPTTKVIPFCGRPKSRAQSAHHPPSPLPNRHPKMSQSLCCFATCLAGSLTMFAFGTALKAHNPFLGYHGDFDEAAASCFKTAIVFAILSAVSMVSFVASAVRAKMGPPAVMRADYHAV